MDKNAIKKFAVWARTELIARVSLKGVEYGITEDNIEDANADSVGGKVLTADEKKQRQALIAEINDKGYKQVMEEVAYTWFNRFSALRFMEVNGYLPSHVRVFTDEENNFKPQIITEAIHLDLDGLNMEKVYELKDAEKTEELYKYLLIVQCNALNKILPGMFQKIADYTELLLPDNLLREGSVIQQMIELIPEEDWKDAVQIIGWLYEAYNIEKNELVYNGNMSKSRISKDLLPAATTIFTPDWSVRYMVENSLGRLWLEGHPDVKEQLLPTEEEQSAYAAGNRDLEDAKWHYYLEEAEQEPEVQTQLAEIRKEYAALTPDQLKVIDPCSGSGHILAYMFDVLIKIYESYGYTTREAVASIVENNLYGLDIDDRAAQLAYFAVMMKARQYDRRFFSRGIQPHVYAIVESNHVDKFAMYYFCNGDMKLTATMDTIIKELHNNELYTRNWWEICDMDRWQPYANGGPFRRWEGNSLDVVDWSIAAKEFYASHGGLYNQKYCGKRGICWNLITSYKNGFRIKYKNYHYSSAAPTIIAKKENFDFWMLAFLNGIVASTILNMYNPTLNTTVGDILSLPVQFKKREQIEPIAEKNVELSQTDWDSFETSWDFQHHPLLRKVSTIAEAFEQWKTECDDRFNQLKTNEEELNRIFIDIYGL